jgi:hypothetical protein
MTASYAVDGQVCEMILEKRHTTKENDETVVDEASSFTDAEVRELLDELVPAPERGAKINEPLNESIVGHSIWVVDTYENIHVEIDGFLDYNDFEDSRSKARSPGHQKPAAKKCAQSANNQKLVIMISWRKRQCSDDARSTRTADAN